MMTLPISTEVKPMVHICSLAFQAAIKNFTKSKRCAWLANEFDKLKQILFIFLYPILSSWGFEQGILKRCHADKEVNSDHRRTNIKFKLSFATFSDSIMKTWLRLELIKPHSRFQNTIEIIVFKNYRLHTMNFIMKTKHSKWSTSIRVDIFWRFRFNWAN